MGGIVNAVNIIDGFNGLARAVVLIGIATLGLAQDAGDPGLAQLCFVVCAVTVGFFVVNFPFGKLFPGDGGACILGFLLAWTSVMLVSGLPDSWHLRSLVKMAIAARYFRALPAPLRNACVAPFWWAVALCLP
ncbi:hypothetical protein [Massilia sp. MS-15]|uniref:hypothetical protein n=1 Tax=Massilia sp. MS-15 TaxID=2878200 RepID=UPI001F173D97|nr:hypothetical protein [Massilia sp. MS-15]